MARGLAALGILVPWSQPTLLSVSSLNALSASPCGISTIPHDHLLPHCQFFRIRLSLYIHTYNNITTILSHAELDAHPEKKKACQGKQIGGAREKKEAVQVTQETNNTQFSNWYNTIDALHRDNIQFNAGRRLVAFAISLIRPLVLCNLAKALHNNGCSSATGAIERSLLHNIQRDTLHISIKRFPIASPPQWRRLDTIAHGRIYQRLYLRSRHLQQ